MALALWKEGVYVAGMTKKLAFPNDLAACHAMLREQALVAVAQDRAITSQESVIKQQQDKVEEQRIEISKLENDLPPLNVATFRERISGGANQGRARDATREEVRCGTDHWEAPRG